MGIGFEIITASSPGVELNTSRGEKAVELPDCLLSSDPMTRISFSLGSFPCTKKAGGCFRRTATRVIKEHAISF